MAEEDQSSAQKVDYELKRSVKSGMGLAVFAVVMTVVAIAAGIYIVVDKMTDEKRINDAVSQKCLTPADAKQGVIDDGTTAPETTIPDIVDSTVTPDASDYIYVADWGVKVKKPSDYYIWYRVIPDTGSAYGARLQISGSKKDAQAWPNYGNFDNGGQLISVLRTTNPDEFAGTGSAPVLIGQVGDYYYFFSGPQACSEAMQGNTEACQAENAVYNDLKAVFSDVNNWSTF